MSAPAMSNGIRDHEVKMILPRSAPESRVEGVSIRVRIRIAEDMRIEEIHQTSRKANAHNSWCTRASVETANEEIISSYGGFTV